MGLQKGIAYLIDALDRELASLPGDAEVLLFDNGFVPAYNGLYTSISEPTMAGYARVPLVMGAAAVDPSAADTALSVGTLAIFLNNSAGPVNIYGYAVVSMSTPEHFLWGEQVPGGGFITVPALGAFSVLPMMRLKSIP